MLLVCRAGVVVSGASSVVCVGVGLGVHMFSVLVFPPDSPPQYSMSSVLAQLSGLQVMHTLFDVAL